MKLFFTILRLSPMILFNYFWWMKRCSKHPEKLPLEVRYKRLRKILVKTFKVLKIDIKVNNSEYINKGDKPVLYTCNHRFFLDPCFLMNLSEKPVSFIAKKELRDKPFLGTAIKSIDGFFIERDDLMSQVRLFKAVAEKMKKDNVSYLIFPEGTRMKDKNKIETLPFKDGSIKLAYWANVDIVPMAMIGNENVFSKKPKGYKKINVGVTFFKPYKINEIKDISTTKITPEIYKMTNDELKLLYQDNLNRNKR